MWVCDRGRSYRVTGYKVSVAILGKRMNPRVIMWISVKNSISWLNQALRLNIQTIQTFSKWPFLLAILSALCSLQSLITPEEVRAIQPDSRLLTEATQEMKRAIKIILGVCI